MRFWQIVQFIVALILFITMVRVMKADAHSWYDIWCCSTYDCQEISADLVTMTSEGYRVRLGPGDHVMATGQHDRLFKWDEIRMAPDDNYHVCIIKYSQEMRCLYIPFQGG